MDLNVPYFSQKDDETVSFYGHAGSGAASLRMVAAYYGKKLSVEEINQRVNNDSQIWNYEKGWVHSGLINIARFMGLHGFRINLNQLQNDDLTRGQDILKKEGAQTDEIRFFTEIFNLAKNTGTDGVFGKLLKDEIPVIVSMKEEFAQTPTTMLAVVTGKEGENYIIHDPWNFGPHYLVEKSRFEKLWTGRMIVIYSDRQGGD